MEDLPPLGLGYIKLGLQDVLYNPKTGQLFTPNTGKTRNINRQVLPDDGSYDIIEDRARSYKRDKKGRFAYTGGSSGKKSTSLKSLTGLKTSDGSIVKSISKHAQQRADERGIYSSSVSKALKRGVPVPGNISGRVQYNYEGTRVIFDKPKQEIVTVIYTGRGEKK